MPLKSANEVRYLGVGLLAFFGLTFQILDDRLGVDFLLDVERWCLDDEVGPILLVLAAPDELCLANLNPAGLDQFRDLIRA